MTSRSHGATGNGKVKGKAGPDAKKKARMRRRYILDTINEKGTVSVEEIRQYAKTHDLTCHTTSLQDDLEEFKALNLPVERDGSHGDFYLLSARVRYWTYAQRKGDKKDEKKAIARIAAEIIWGDRATNSRQKKHKEGITSEQEQILYMLDHPPNANRDRSVAAEFAQFLEDHWVKRHRQVALDSGTTTEEIATEIAKEEGGRSLRQSTLRVVTNSPEIERLLEPPSKAAGVIGLGGMLRKDTSARTGKLAEDCLAAWNIHFDITMVGATSLRFDDHGHPRSFACDSEDEATTKALFSDRAGLKCVVIDSSKAEKFSSSSFDFCQVSPSWVDVVITDEGIQKTPQGRSCFDWFWRSGIAVLAAPLMKGSE